MKRGTQGYNNILNQLENQDQNHARTRSRLALPEFNVEYDRSPLKHARDAMRRANARFSRSPGPSDTNTKDSERGVEGEVNAEMHDDAATSVSYQARRTEEPGGDAPGDAMTEKENVKRTSEDEGLTRVPLRHPFGSTSGAVDAHPKHPKRARSVSFDEEAPPSPTESDRKACGKDAVRHLAQSPKQLWKELNDSNEGVDASNHSSTSVGPAEMPTGTSNQKRAKLGKQSSIDAFFARSSSSSSSSEKKSQPSLPATTPSRRIFSESISTPPTQINKPTIFGKSVVDIPKTPTIKQLQAIPSLDLRMVTPSPRKRTLQLGLGAPGVKSPVKARAVSAGATLALIHSETTDEDGNNGSRKSKEDFPGKVSEQHEETESVFDQREEVPGSNTASLPTGTEERKMDVDPITCSTDASTNRKTEISPAAEQDSPSTATSISTSGSSTAHSSFTSEDTSTCHPSPIPVIPTDIPIITPVPSTPQHKILPSRPLPSGRLLSTKSQLAKLLSLSPLTPLPLTSPVRDDGEEYDYEEEERTLREELKQARERPIVQKLISQDETEAATGSTTGASSSTAYASVPAPSASNAVVSNKKAGSKGKHKGKLLSTTSRVTTGPAGIKKRKSLVAMSSTTPRMRLTRASVLRQKAIQAQMRTPKDGKVNRRPSLFGTSNTNNTEGQLEDVGMKSKETTKEASGQERSQNVVGEKQPETKPPRKSFVLTVPSSLSPRKSSSAKSSANSSLTLKSTPLESKPAKPFTFSLYPPSFNDPATTEQAQRALSKLSSALDKLTMPPPSRPDSSASRNGELRRPASEQRERIRPATSLGFTREMSVPVSGPVDRARVGRPRAASRAGSVDTSQQQAKRTILPPPPPPAFGSSLGKDKGKTKAFAATSRTAPIAFRSGSRELDSGGKGQMLPPSSFRFGGGIGTGTTGIFGRAIPRIKASQRTSLETVEGSPVKGGCQSRAFTEEDEDEIVATDGAEAKDRSGDGDTSTASSNAVGDMSLSSADGSDNANGALSGSGKELKRITKLNASRRASMAFSALSQQLATSPDTFSPFSTDSKDDTPITGGQPCTVSSIAGHRRTPSDTSRPVRAAAPRSFAFGYPSLGRTQSETAVGSKTRSSSVTPVGASESESDGTGRSNKKSGGSMGRTKMPGSLDVLDQCTVFVDVRTEEGEDAGALFVDMLRGLGAKVLSRVGQTCTHIVYKNGLASTLTKYRLLDEPRPSVVGIGWVVECVEKRARVEESRFQVDIEGINVAGMLKRRRSFLPKQISSTSAYGPMDAFISGSGTEPAAAGHPVPRACVESDPASEDGDTSQERGTGLNSSIHPLERARRRSVMIPR